MGIFSFVYHQNESPLGSEGRAGNKMETLNAGARGSLKREESEPSRKVWLAPNTDAKQPGRLNILIFFFFLKALPMFIFMNIETMAQLTFLKNNHSSAISTWYSSISSSCGIWSDADWTFEILCDLIPFLDLGKCLIFYDPLRQRFFSLKREEILK